VARRREVIEDQNPETVTAFEQAFIDVRPCA
jgi:hypothetical protein